MLRQICCSMLENLPFIIVFFCMVPSLDVLEFNSCKRRLIDVISLFSPCWQNGEPGSNYEKATVAHAKRIMKPFVLRRLKKDVSILIWTHFFLISADWKSLCQLTRRWNCQEKHRTKSARKRFYFLSPRPTALSLFLGCAVRQGNFLNRRTIKKAQCRS